MMSISPHTLTQHRVESSDPTGYELDLRSAFDDLDVDRSGHIDKANLIEVLKRFGVSLTEVNVEQLLVHISASYGEICACERTVPS